MFTMKHSKISRYEQKIFFRLIFHLPNHSHTSCKNIKFTITASGVSLPRVVACTDGKLVVLNNGTMNKVMISAPAIWIYTPNFTAVLLLYGFDSAHTRWNFRPHEYISSFSCGIKIFVKHGSRIVILL